jgi:hypothetical protein
MWDDLQQLDDNTWLVMIGAGVLGYFVVTKLIRWFTRNGVNDPDAKK